MRLLPKLHGSMVVDGSEIQRTTEMMHQRRLKGWIIYPIVRFQPVLQIR